MTTVLKYWLAVFMISAIFSVRESSAQILLGAGGAMHPRDSHTLLYVRASYALDSAFPAILSAEYITGERSYGEGFQGGRRYFGGSLGFRFSHVAGAELGLYAGKVSYRGSGYEYWTEEDPLVLFSFLIFTPGVSHIVLGTDFDENIRFGYSIQLYD